MIEREIKVIASEKKIKYLESELDRLTHANRMLQINYYYDTPDFQLNLLGSSLRVRQKGNQLVRQYKYEKTHIGIETTCVEFETPVQSLPLFISAGTLPNKISNPTLIYSFIGTLTTERINYSYGDVVISLDKNYYLGHSDCEIEIEFQEYKKALDALALLSVNEKEISKVGKYSRFVTKHKNMHK